MPKDLHKGNRCPCPFRDRGREGKGIRKEKRRSSYLPPLPVLALVDGRLACQLLADPYLFFSFVWAIGLFSDVNSLRFS